jgi:uncharacterized membrane protein
MTQYRVTKAMLRHGDIIVAVAAVSMLVVAIVFLVSGQWFLGSFFIGVAIVGGWMALFQRRMKERFLEESRTWGESDQGR